MKKILSFLICLILALSLANSAYAQNLVQDGSFEEPEVTDPNYWQIFDGTDIFPWIVTGTSADGDIEGLEYQKNGISLGSTAQEGNQYVELDSYYPVTLTQEIDSCSSGKYDVSFYYAPRPNHSDNQMEVKFGEETILTVTSPELLGWNYFQQEVTGPTEDRVTISFRETGADDQLGMFLDNVSVECVNPPDDETDVCPEGFVMAEEPMDSLTIPCGNGEKISSSELTADQPYVLKASGTCFWRHEFDAGGYLGDAEYWLRYDGIYGADGWTDMGIYSLAMWNGSAAVEIDFSDPVDEIYHTYAKSYTPSATEPVKFFFNDTAYGDNSGSLQLDIYQCQAVDSDNDTVPDSQDLCPGTEPDKPTVNLGTNRYVWYDDGYFTTLVPAKKGKFDEVKSQFSLENTFGCSCTQILDLINDKSGDELLGHYKFGCSKSILDDFIASFEE